MGLRKAAFALALLVAAAAPVAPAAAAAEAPLLSIGPAAPPPTIDGRLDDPCWKTAACASPFLEASGKRLATEQTRAFMAYSSDSLYFAFECLESRMDRVAASQKARDASLWVDDCVEVFLRPRRMASYYHIMVNSLGTQYDEIGKDRRAWEARWQAAATRGADRWTVEIALPFSELGMTKGTRGQMWLNFCREEKPGGENSSWSPTPAGFHDPGRFGIILLRGAGWPTVQLRETGDLFLGAHEAGMWLCAGREADEVKCLAQVDRSDRWVPRFTLQPGESRLATIPYEVRKEGEHTVTLSAWRGEGDPLFISAPLPVSVEPLCARLEVLARDIDRIIDAAASKGRRAEADAARETRTQVRRLLAVGRRREQWSPLQGLRRDWERLGQEVAEVERRVVQARYRAFTAHPETGYAVGVESPLKKVMRDLPFEGELGRPAVLEAARNESEAVQVVLIALDKPLAGVRIEATDLIGPRAQIIPKTRVSLNLVGWVQTRRPVYDVNYVGWHPDPLLDYQPFDLPAGALQPLWVTVRVPAGAAPGTYKGNIVIAPRNAPGSAVPLVVRVWGFSLPLTTHLKTAFALAEGEIAAWYGWKDLPDEVRRAWYEFLLERRINPTDIYSQTPVPPERLMDFSSKRGLNSHCLGVFDSADFTDPERLKTRIAFVRDHAARMRAEGLLKGAYIYGFDEVQPDRYDQLKAVFGALREAIPGLPRACTVVPTAGLHGYVDIWVPLTAGYDRAVADARRARGEEVWWYICCGPRHPYANWFIDYPAIEARLLFWMNWKYGVNGLLYYSLNMWQSNRMAGGLPAHLQPHADAEALEAVRAGRRWPQVPWNTFTYDRYNGDGHLVYPGPQGRPLSSLRLECIRDGIEDYECLWLLSDLARRLEERGGPADRELAARARVLLGVDTRAVRSLTDFTRDPQVLQRARREVAAQIVACRAALGLSEQ